MTPAATVTVTLPPCSTAAPTYTTTPAVTYTTTPAVTAPPVTAPPVTAPPATPPPSPCSTAPPVTPPPSPCSTAPPTMRLYADQQHGVAQQKSMTSKLQGNAGMFMPALMMFGVLGCCCLAAGVGAALRLKAKKRSSRRVQISRSELLSEDDDLEQVLE